MERALAVMSTLGVQSALEETIRPAFELRHSVQLSMTYDPTSVLLREIAAGRRADVVVAIDTAIDTLIADGTLLPEKRTDVARTTVGLAKLPGSSPLDISTPGAFLKALRGARSVAYSRTGASGLFFRQLIASLGIADEVNAKAVIIPKGFTAECLLRGEAELAVQQVSELMSVPGVDIVGPFPEPHRPYTTFTAAVFRACERRTEAFLFLDALASVEAEAAFQQAGLERVGLAGAHAGARVSP